MPSVPYHTHQFSIPTATDDDMEVLSSASVVVTPANLANPDAATKIVDTAAPVASQAEAAAGTNNVKRMTPLTTAQAIAARVGTTAGMVAAGDDSRIVNAVPNSRTLTAGAGIAAIGDLTANRTIALTLAAQASLSLADTSVQPARSISVGSGLTGGGDLSADRSISLSATTAMSLARADQLPTAAAIDKGGQLLTLGSGFMINRLQRYSAVNSFSNSQLSDVYSGNPSLDVAAAFQTAVTYAQNNGMILHIPQMAAKFSAQISHDSRLNVECDDHTSLTWTNISNSGWKVTGYLAGGAPGYTHLHLPQLIGPNSLTGYTGNAATNTYDTIPFGGAGLTIEDCVWAKVEVMQQKAWSAAIDIFGNNYGCFNLDLKLGTIDLCDVGIRFRTANGKAVAQSRIVADNIFARLPLAFLGGAGPIFEWDIDALGLHVAQLNGICIFASGITMSGAATMTDVRVRAKAENGYFSNDSPNNVPVGYLGPIISGDQTGPGGVTGYANGSRNHFALHLNERPLSTARTFKLMGANNTLQVTTPTYAPTNGGVSIPLSQTQGLANFNGGKPCIHRLSRVSITLASNLAPGNSTDFYYYNELIHADVNLPLVISGMANQDGLAAYDLAQGTAVPYEAKIRIRNESTATLNAGTALNFWIEIPYA